jgi:hypothetical protein
METSVLAVLFLIAGNTSEGDFFKIIWWTLSVVTGFIGLLEKLV